MHKTQVAWEDLKRKIREVQLKALEMANREVVQPLVSRQKAIGVAMGCVAWQEEEVR